MLQLSCVLITTFRSKVKSVKRKQTLNCPYQKRVEAWASVNARRLGKAFEKECPPKRFVHSPRGKLGPRFPIVSEGIYNLK